MKKLFQLILIIFIVNYFSFNKIKIRRDIAVKSLIWINFFIQGAQYSKFDQAHIKSLVLKLILVL